MTHDLLESAAIQGRNVLDRTLRSIKLGSVAARSSNLHGEFNKNPSHKTLPLGALGSPWEGALGNPLRD